MALTYKCLATTTTNGASELLWTNIPQTYQDLVIHMGVRVNNASSNWQDVHVRPDSNTTAGYAQYTTLSVDGSNAPSSGSSSNSSPYWVFPAPTSNNTIYSSTFLNTGWLYIPFYLNTLFAKQTWMQVGSIRPNQSSVARVWATANWYSEFGTAITSIKMEFNSSTEAGTVLSLYGIEIP